MRRKEQRLSSVKGPPLDQIDVEVAVVVVVEERCTCAHDLRHVVVAGGARDVLEVQPDV